MVKPFVIHHSEVVLQTPIFDLRKDTATNPGNGHTGEYVVLENPDWVNVVALTRDEQLILVRQWRHGTRQIETELPAGMVDKGEEPVVAAARELMEETGYEAIRWEPLGSVRPNLAYQSNTCFTFLATGCRLEGEPRFDRGEFVETILVPVGEIPRMVKDGELHSALSVSALFWWLAREGKLAW